MTRLTSRRRRLVLAVTLVSSLPACNADDALRRFTPRDADARARSYLALFTQRRAAEAESRLVEGLTGPEAHAGFARLDSLLAGQPMDSMRVVGSQVNVVNGVRHVNLTYEARPPMGWMVANVATVDSAGTWFVEGVSARAIPQPLERLAEFRLGGQTPVHYLWLVLTGLCAALSLGTAAVIAMQRQMRKRWRWVLLSLVGLGAFNLDWSSGQVAIQPVRLQLFAAAVMRPGPGAPWILTFAIPVGAIAALARYRRWRREGSLAVQTDPTEPAPLSEATA